MKNNLLEITKHFQLCKSMEIAGGFDLTKNESLLIE